MSEFKALAARLFLCSNDDARPLQEKVLALASIFSLSVVALTAGAEAAHLFSKRGCDSLGDDVMSHKSERMN